MDCNQTVICGKIMEIAGVRYTPAGMPVVEFRISHVSSQVEVGKARKVECEILVVALGQIAETVAGLQPGIMVKLGGFLAKKSRMSMQLVLHVNKVDFI